MGQKVRLHRLLNRHILLPLLKLLQIPVLYLLLDSTIVMTEIKDMQQIIKELKESGIQNQTVVVSGYGKEGASGSMPSKVKLTGKIGSRSEWDVNASFSIR